jgi:hypothetical protein
MSRADGVREVSLRLAHYWGLGTRQLLFFRSEYQEFKFASIECLNFNFLKYIFRMVGDNTK